VRGLVMLLAACAITGCAAASKIQLPLLSSHAEPITSAATVVPASNQLPGLIGREQRHRVQPGETLLDIARDAGLGFQQVQDANPTASEWTPTPNSEVIIPSRWIVPRSHYRGLVINIPEMRLYMFPAKTAPGESAPVRTWPVGIGTEHAPSPVGGFTVLSKEENPTWYPPPSIQRTMDEPRAVVPPGPDNPLGKYRLRLSKGLYQIHGTDVPWSIGRLTTHGCIRLYPEHISQLYELVHPGMSGELIYRPVKFGEDGGEVYVEVHRDLYGRIPNLQAYALAEARKAGVSERIEPSRLKTAVKEHRGIPVNVTRRKAGEPARLLGGPARVSPRDHGGG
jgi:L,D-transpeptidase ErfK/SrfK